jgi:hypothetical protein
MAKKPEAKAVASSLRLDKSGHRPDATPRLKPSALLDTRVVYCGDNLEQPEQMQNEKGRMIKPAHSLFLHSSFILLNFPVPASHYVKAMLDQIFGETILN